MKKGTAFLIVLGFLVPSFMLGAAQNAGAAPIRWDLHDAYFEDGSEASGYFIYDAETNDLSDYRIVTGRGPGFGFDDQGYEYVIDGVNDSASYANWTLTLSSSGLYEDTGGGVLDVSEHFQIGFYDSFPNSLTVEGQMIELRSTPEYPFFVDWVSLPPEAEPQELPGPVWRYLEDGYQIEPGPGEQTVWHGPYILGTSVEVTPTPVPEPTTMLLLGAGLAGLAGFRRKFRNN